MGAKCLFRVPLTLDLLCLILELRFRDTIPFSVQECAAPNKKLEGDE
jgi:hypothetical protein